MLEAEGLLLMAFHFSKQKIGVRLLVVGFRIVTCWDPWKMANLNLSALGNCFAPLLGVRFISFRDLIGTQVLTCVSGQSLSVGRMVWVRREHPVPAAAMGRDTSHQPRVPKAPSSLALGIAGMGQEVLPGGWELCLFADENSLGTC